MTTTTDLKKFAQAARRQLRDEVARRLEQVLHTDSAELREKKQAIRELQEQITRSSKAEVIDRVAYTWFNRFCALRFMDLNRYTRLGVVSEAEGFSQPEILQEAKRGYMDDDLQRYVDRQAVFALLNGQRPSSDPQGEAYRLLLVGVCNSYNPIMPFMFEKIADYTELLMPLDLLSEHSVLHALREAMTIDNCQDVEIIGWLYQYYTSERKDEVFEALKNGQKIETQDIPAATQLFTPHWIVRYLVENTLGRLWLLNHPSSKLAEKMDYYIKPVQEEADFLRISSPEEIKLCDNTCGSGHMLTYSFDLLYAIYEEEGYPAVEIPRLILEKNLYGIEIDPRAGALAAFALFMKGRAKDRRFFSRPVQPNICVLENVTFTDQELDEYMSAVGNDLFTEPLRQTLKQFEQAETFGSLINPVLSDTDYVCRTLQSKHTSDNIFLYSINERVMQVLKQTEYLTQRYHIVVSNPPYMGSKGMNVKIKKFAETNYADYKYDTFAMFIIRNLNMVLPNGHLGYLTPFVWMFISSYETLRKKLIDSITLTNLVQLEYNAFEPAAMPVCAFTVENGNKSQRIGNYVKLSSFRGADNQSVKTLEAINNTDCGWYFQYKMDDFKRIAGWPIAYWISNTTRNSFSELPSLSSVAEPKQGLITGDNDKFMRYWFEVATNNIGFGIPTRQVALQSAKKWFPYNKGGDFRKWYGNFDFIVNWANDGEQLRNFFGEGDGRLKSRPQNIDYYFREAITWSKYSSSYFGVRYAPMGSIFSDAGCCVFLDQFLLPLLGFLSSKVCSYFLTILNPTLTFQVGDIGNLPILTNQLQDYDESIAALVNTCISLSREDWDASETSWDFQCNPLVAKSNREEISLSHVYNLVRSDFNTRAEHLLEMEVRNNKLFINL